MSFGTTTGRGSMLEFFDGRHDMLLCYRGGDLSDYSRSKNNLVTGDPAYVGTTNQYRSAVDFKGTSRAVTTSAITYPSGIVTLLVWMKINTYRSTGVAGLYFVNEENVLANSFQYNESTATPKDIRATITGTAGTFRQHSIPKVPAGIEMLHAIMWDNSTVTGNIRIGLNGQEVATTVTISSKAGSGAYTARKLCVAGSLTTLLETDISVSDFALFSSDLFSQGDIIQDYYDWSTGFESDDVAGILSATRSPYYGLLTRQGASE